jgi:hypothetical protein
MAKGNSAVVINSGRFDFYKNYLNFLKPINPISQLRNKQLEVLAALLYKREEISKRVNDLSLIPKLLFSADVRESILEMCHISETNYYGIVAALRKHKIVVDNDLSRKVIPEPVDNKFTLIISFTINDK